MTPDVPNPALLSRKELGSLRLKVQCHEEKILESRFYAPFVQLMLKAVEDPMVIAAALCHVLYKWL